MPRAKKYATASARQQAYLQRVYDGQSGIATKTDDPKQGAKKVTIVLPLSAALALESLAKHQGLSQSEFISSLVLSMRDKMLAGMTDAELEAFYRGP